MELTKEHINKSLYRSLRLGAQYERYMPFSDCSSVKPLGKGDTSEAIRQMRQTALKYQHHTQELSKIFFSESNLEQLCTDIHQFLYWHLQYSIDGDAQLLRSPACSWRSRYQGIDCKSYSIFASTILLNRGVKHYMRRIKQVNNPNGFTHVYVIVPIDQKKATLKQGYYIIDGTINLSVKKELPFLVADDIFVADAKNEINAKRTQKTQTGLGGVFMSMGSVDVKREAWKDFIKTLEELHSINGENPDLVLLKKYIYSLIKQGQTQVDIKYKDFSVIVNGRKFSLWKPKVQGLSAPVSDTYTKLMSNENLENLIDEAQNYASNINEGITAEAKQRNQQNISMVGDTIAGVASFIPVYGQIIALCVAAVTAIVKIISFFSTNPCSGAFYTSDYISKNLNEFFLPQFKGVMKSVKEKLEQGLEPVAIGEINKVLREIDLGVAHYKHEVRTHHQPCSSETLKSYVNFVDNIKKAVNEMLVLLKARLDLYFNVAILEKKAPTSARSWYFFVPSGRNITTGEYRELKVESRNEKRGIYPYGSELSFDAWLEENVKIFSIKYGQSIANAYKNEMLPFKDKIADIRKNIYLPVVTQVYMEEQLRVQQYNIYLKYDKEYTQKLLEESQSKTEAYAKANKTFWEEIKKIRKIRIQEEKAKLQNLKKASDEQAKMAVGLENKKTLNMVLLAVLGLGVMKMIKD